MSAYASLAIGGHLRVLVNLETAAGDTRGGRFVVAEAEQKIFRCRRGGRHVGPAAITNV